MKRIDSAEEIAILLVDDRPQNLLSLEELLGAQGYTLVRAISGNEALCQALKRDFSLILLDVQMPEMDGFETAELLRINPKTMHIPIIFITAGMKNLQFQFKGYDVGAVDYLTKPIEPLFLQSKVKIFADLYHQRREIERHKNHLQDLVELRTIELQASNQKLQSRNRELEITEELLRGQIVEFVETHEQLKATEESLRLQLDQYAAGQKLLAAANRNLQMLFDVSPLAILILSSPAGIIRAANHTFSSVFGYPADQVVGRCATAFDLWVDRSQQQDLWAQLRTEQRVFGFDSHLKTLTGEILSVLVYANLIDFKNEKCLLLVFLDVTEQKRMEDRIRQTQKMEVIGQLAGGVAHDFNNMLAAIQGSAELLALKHLKDDALGLKRVSDIQQAARRSADLTRQLLAFARKERKTRVQVSIDAIVQEVIALLEHTIDKKITINTSLDAKHCWVKGDHALLQNALLNLGINARDAMPDGGTISFSTDNIHLDACRGELSNFSLVPGDYIEITVADTGTGMSQETMSKVFEPFFTTKEIGKGTGLGLAAVYGTLSDHQGAITLSSRLGEGTSFHLYLPLSGARKSAEPEIGDLTQGSGGVLLVDDEEILRDIGRSILTDLGYRTFVAADGAQALEIYAREQQHISLVILDMVMPKMGGRETLIQLRAKFPEVRVLMASGFQREGAAAELAALGASGFLQKPYSMSALSRAVAGLKNREEV
jgi:PAS domain S-box-containing protein